MKNLLILILSLFFVTQSCTVYHKKPVSMEEAIGKGKVKIVDNAGKEFKFKNIVLNDNMYYGLGENKVISRILIPEEISSIFLKNNQSSKLRSVLTIIGVGLGVSFGVLVVVVSIAYKIR